MDLIQAIIIGVVEGITEFLPISSTGHMIIASHLMGMEQTEFLKTFEVAIQLGAIGAVFSLYWRVFLLDWEVTLKVLAAFLPTAVIGFLLYKVVKHVLLGNIMVVGWALILGGIFLLVFELIHKGQSHKTEGLEHITYRQAILIGICQSLSVIPGVSRSAATVVGGLMQGISRKTIVEFSFLLAVPTMLAATGYDLLKSGVNLTGEQWGLFGVGFSVSFVVAFLAVKFLLHYIQKNDFIPFGVYRIGVGLMVLFYFSKI
jgi:undecaprenyl-diphosphatase